MTISELSQFYHITREIADLRRRIRELELKAQPSAARMSGMPGGGGVADPTGDLAAELAEAKDIAAKIEAGSVTVAIKGGENGKTYGSVSTKEIADAAKKQLGLDIDKKKIVLAEPLKTFGTHEAVIKLHREVQAKLKVKVVEA